MGKNYHFYNQVFSRIKKTKETESVLIKAAYIDLNHCMESFIFYFISPIVCMSKSYTQRLRIQFNTSIHC